jgi:hypothetical protein
MHLAASDAINSQQILNNGIASIRRLMNMIKHSPNLRSKLTTAQATANVPKHVMIIVNWLNFLVFNFKAPIL